MEEDKIIQKEKELQDKILSGIAQLQVCPKCNSSMDIFSYDQMKCCDTQYLYNVEELRDLQGSQRTHKQSLINLKEFLEGELEFIKNHVYYDTDLCTFDHHGYCQDHHTCGEDKCSNAFILNKICQLKRIIKALSEMIKRYE